MALTLMTICSNCGENYLTELLPSEKSLPEIETYCSRCGFTNTDIINEEEIWILNVKGHKWKLLQ